MTTLAEAETDGIRLGAMHAVPDQWPTAEDVQRTRRRWNKISHCHGHAFTRGFTTGYVCILASDKVPQEDVQHPSIRELDSETWSEGWAALLR